MLPVFVPLNDNVIRKLEELRQEHWPDPADADHQPSPDHVQDEQPPKKRRRIYHDRPPAIDMDGDRNNMQVEEKKEAKEDVMEEEEHDVQWELAHWFSPTAPFLSWYAPQSQLKVQWKAI